jgi:signal transduction histidine kinase/ligand-binding sensor domain-containing protein
MDGETGIAHLGYPCPLEWLADLIYVEAVISAATRLDRLVLWAGLILLLTGSPAPASTNDAWFTRVWKTDDGLINNNILATVQGPDGYLWVAPSVGLMRFDGVQFSRFPLENFTGPIDNHISTALRGRKGVLWIATYGGTVIGLKPDFSVVRLPKTSLPAGAPLTLAEDGAGSLWLGYDTVICRVKDGQVTQYGTKEGVPSGSFRSLISDGAGNMWLAQGNQIRFFRDGRFQPVARAQGVQCLAATPTNAVWFVAGTNLFTCDTGGSKQDYGACQGLATASRRALLEDRNGAVWIGTYGDGLFRFGKSGFEQIETSNPLILSLAEDHEGNLWVGTAGGGLDRVSLSGVRLEASKPISGQIQSICEGTDGALWGANRDGLLVSHVDGQWIPAFTNAPFSGTVRCVAADRSGGIWIGTRNGKVLRLDSNHYAFLDQTNGLVLRTVFALLPASTGDLWIVGEQHIQCWHDGRLQNVKLPRPVERFSAITEDAAGNIWVGASGGVMRFDGKHFVDESSHLPIANRNICCLYGTPDGSLWISCGGLGLLRFKDGRVGEAGVAQGLFNDYISQIVADGHGWLWFASDHGIFKIRQRELEQAMEDDDIKLHPIVYGRNEGLSSLEALFSTTGSPFVLPRALCTHDGRVWLLTHTGVVAASPGLLPDHYPAPPVLLTRVAMDGQTVASYGDVAPTQTVANLKTLNALLRLPPGHRHLEFDYTAFHLRAPGNVRFRYQLAGFDNAWIDAGAKHSADYSRLTAGNYQFRVEACIGDGPWSETPAALAFAVAPFFWQTWWFRLGMLLLFTSSVIAVVRYISFRRMRRKLRAVEQQAAIERERGRIARDIHDDLGERLTEIQLLTGIAQLDSAQPDKAIAHVRQIASATRQATDALDEIVWAVNPRNDTLPHLIDYLGQFTVEFLRTAGIHCRTDLPEHPPVKPVPAEVRHALFLVIKESLNNIVRHAGATEVSLLILVTDESIRVILEDNGRGFNGEVQNRGADGLENMRRRMVEIGGQFQIQSKPGTGTCVSFNGPWLAKNQVPN